MAAGDKYATEAELKARVSITDSVDDAVITAVLEAASRRIDQECGRHFWIDSAATARYYTPEAGDLVFIDDIGDTTNMTVKTDEDGDRTYERTWTSSDYELEPANPVNGITYPKTLIRVQPLGSQSFPVATRSLEIIAKHGWPAVPDAINEACLLLGARLLERRNAPFGTQGDAQIGVVRIPAVDSDVKALMWPYVKIDVRAI